MPKGKKATYHWSKTEQKRYVDFLWKNYKSFGLNPNDRRLMGINSRMS
jgi:hypothetical protein